MNKPEITKECIVPCFESKYLNVYDIQYEKGRHYYNATRKPMDTPTCLLNTEEFKKVLPDAVSCFVIIKTPGQEPKLMLSYEYRYPVGQFLLGVTAGLMDPSDKEAAEPRFETAKREIFEETGIKVKDSDKLAVVNPLVFSTPGMTDESNALVAAVIELENTDVLSRSNCEDSECFNGFELLTREDAVKLIKDGKCADGTFYPLFTWAALMYFISDMWRDI